MSNHLKNSDYKNSLYAKRRGCLNAHTGFFFSYIFQSDLNNQYLKHFINSNVITPRVLRSPVMFIRSLFISIGYALNYFKKSLKQHCYDLCLALTFSGLMSTNHCTIKHIVMNRGYVTIKDLTGGLSFGCNKLKSENHF